MHRRLRLFLVVALVLGPSMARAEGNGRPTENGINVRPPPPPENQSQNQGRPPSLGATNQGAADPVADRNKLLDKIMQQPIKLQFHTWTQGAPPLRLGKADAQLCLLSGVTGKFAGAGEAVSLYIDDGATGGPQWTLGGHSGQDQLKATAVCVLHTDLAMPVETKKDFDVHFYPQVESGPCGKYQNYKSQDDLDATAPFLSGLSGRFSGGAERADAYRNASTVAVEVKACSDGGIAATGMGVISPTGHVKFRTPVARGNNAKEATFSYAFDGPPKQGWYSELVEGKDLVANVGGNLWVLPADEAVCGLVIVGGKFQGYGEEISVNVAQNTDGRRWWRLYVGSQAEGAQASGAVRCLARDQR